MELFTSDTLKGGAKKPEVVKVLCGNSGADVDWLVEKFNLDLSLVARLGGHSAPRTHRGKERRAPTARQAVRRPAHPLLELRAHLIGGAWVVNGGCSLLARPAATGGRAGACGARRMCAARVARAAQPLSHAGHS